MPGSSTARGRLKFLRQSLEEEPTREALEVLLEFGAVSGGEVAEPDGSRMFCRVRLLEHEPELAPPCVEAGALVARANPRLRGGSEEIGLDGAEEGVADVIDGQELVVASGLLLRSLGHVLRVVELRSAQVR